MQRTLVIASACAVLIASGVVHGVWTDRWSEQTDLVAAAARLEKLPMTIGAWHGSGVELEKDLNTSLAGMVARRYVHAGNGKAVTILLACGRSGAVCTHTPDVCYGSSGFEVEKPKRFQMPSKSGEMPAEFWTARFVKERTTGKTHLRIFWAWHGADSWKIAEYPRVSFAGEKVLHKLYVIREMIQPDEPLEGDACVEFMQDLLPVLRGSVLTERK
jgi:hypothetical protein